MSKKKNDLTAFKSLPKSNVLKTELKKTAQVQKSGATGRPPKPVDEKESVKVVFSITPIEEAELLKKTNGSSIGVFVKKYLREQTDLLK